MYVHPNVPDEVATDIDARLLLLCDRWWCQDLGMYFPQLSFVQFIKECLQWKKYLTTMQIVQFVIDLFAVYFGSE